MAFSASRRYSGAPERLALAFGSEGEKQDECRHGHTYCKTNSLYGVPRLALWREGLGFTKVAAADLEVGCRLWDGGGNS